MRRSPAKGFLFGWIDDRFLRVVAWASGLGLVA